VTPKGQGRDLIMFDAPYLHNGARYMRWGIATQMATSVIDHYWKLF